MAPRRVLVTGSARGIGAAIAHAFAANGDRVAAHRRTPGPLDLPGEGHAAVTGDLSDPRAVRTLVDAAADALGGLDVVVNNAAVSIEHKILDVSYDDWQSA